MDGFFVAKLKKVSNVIPKPKVLDEGINGSMVDDELENELSADEGNEVVFLQNVQKKKRISESPQTATSPEKSVTEDLKTSAKKRKRNKKKKVNSEMLSQVLASPNGVSTPDTSIMEGKSKQNKKRKVQQTDTGDDASPPKKKHLDIVQNSTSPGLTKAQKRRRKLKLKKQKLAAGGQVPLTPANEKSSDNQEATKQKSLQKMTSEKNKHTSNNKNLSPSKDQPLPTSQDRKISKRARRRLNLKKKKEAEMAGEKPSSVNSAQPVALPGENKKTKKRRKKLHIANEAESGEESISTKNGKFVMSISQ